VSQQLRALEAEVGKPLLLREGRTLRLTSAGRALARRCEDVLAALERASAEVNELAGTIDGELAVGCFTAAFSPSCCRWPRRSEPGTRSCSSGSWRGSRGDHRHAAPAPARSGRRLPLPAPRHRAPGRLIALPVGDDPFLICVPEKLREAVETDGLLRCGTDLVGFPQGSCREANVHAGPDRGLHTAAGHTCASIRWRWTWSRWSRRDHDAGHGRPQRPPGVALVPAPGLHRKIEVVVRAGAERQPVIAAALAALAER